MSLLACTQINYVPDFAEIKGPWERKGARQAYEIAPSAKVVLIYGGLTERKGIRQILSAMAEEQVDQDVVVLFAGTASDRVMRLLETPAVQRMLQHRRIITSLKFHDSDEEQKAFMASDAVWLGYVDGFLGSSGVLYQAVQCELPVIAMHEGVIGQTVKKNRIGICVDPDSRVAVAEALNDFPKLKSFASRHIENFRCMSARHSAETHMGALKSVFESSISY